MNDGVRVLLIEDDEDDYHLTLELLREARGEFFLEWVSTYHGALEEIEKSRHDIYLVDYRLGERDGLELVRRAMVMGCKAPLIILTGMGDHHVDRAAAETGAADYLVKNDLSSELLERSIRYSLARKRNEELLREAGERLESQVKLRTAELSEANRRLQDEIEGREQKERELVEREAQLRESEELYRLLAEKSSDGIAIVERGKILFVNPALARLLETSRDSLLGEDLAHIFPSPHKENFLGILEQIGKGKYVDDFEVPHAGIDGREIWTQWRLSPVDWDSGPACLVTVRDISEIKAREAAAENESEHLRTEYIMLKAALKERYRFGDLVGKSPAMQEVYDLILNAAKNDANAVIEGESGTGKELVARAIHDLSDRARGPFVPVNCGAIPEALFESEFFGHKRGAFTGASMETHGFFGLSQGGTLFLDEVGELTPGMQVKLLRAIEGSGYSQVGGHVAIKSDVRIIAATHRNLARRVEEGAMREDFYYRIHVVGIRLPPLRDRREDIPLLIDYYTRKHFGSETPPTLPGTVIGSLCSHHWPGNVRELQNVLNRYFAMNRLDFLDSPVTCHLSAEPHAEAFSTGRESGLREALEAYEKRYIAFVLEQNQWRKGKSAEVLGIPERTFYRKLKKYRLV